MAGHRVQFHLHGALLCIATLQSPTTGSRLSLRIRQIVEQQGRSDLYERLLAVIGVKDTTREHVEQLLEEGAEAFDLAVQVIRTPHPFGHKLHAHLRPYFVESCRSLLADGYHREAMYWLLPFYTASIDTIMADGPDAEKPRFAARLDRLLGDLDLATPESRAARAKKAIGLHGEMSMLASDIVDSNPEIID